MNKQKVHEVFMELLDDWYSNEITRPYITDHNYADKKKKEYMAKFEEAMIQDEYTDHTAQ